MRTALVAIALLAALPAAAQTTVPSATEKPAIAIGAPDKPVPGAERLEIDVTAPPASVPLDAPVLPPVAAGLGDADSNLRCQALFGAVAKAAQIRRDATEAVSAENAIALLQRAIIKSVELAAAPGEVSAAGALAKGREAMRNAIPFVRDQAARTWQSIRRPAEATDEALALRKAACDALVTRTENQGRIEGLW